MKLLNASAGITKPVIQRLGRALGANLNDLMYEEVRAVIKNFLHSVLRKAFIYLDYAGAKTITEIMVDAAFRYSLCTPQSKAIYHSCTLPDLSIPTKAFARLVREVAQDYKNDPRFSEKAMALLHGSTENYIEGLLRDAKLIAINAKRTRVMPKDINTARRLRDNHQMIGFR
jgi:histone H3/H4